jgi:hypothetical protein
MCIVHIENCDENAPKDKSLPVNSYLVTYHLDGKKICDIVICHKRADVFDMYWDKYRKDLKSIEWTDGTVSARLWGHKAKESKKKR